MGGGITVHGQYQVFDELAVWGRPLTAEEVKAMYNGGFGAKIVVDKADKSSPAGK